MTKYPELNLDDVSHWPEITTVKSGMNIAYYTYVEDVDRVAVAKVSCISGENESRCEILGRQSLSDLIDKR